MSQDQNRARVFRFATSIPALLLYQPVLDDPVGYSRRSRIGRSSSAPGGAFRKDAPILRPDAA